jgi:hypothetical protein
MRDPQKGNGGAVLVRLRGSLYDQLEDWRRSQPEIPSRSEALRCLLAQALTASDDQAGEAAAS